MNQTLLQIVVDVISFLALSDNETVAEDAAVEQLEHIAAILKQLPRDDRDHFLSFVAESASQSNDPQRAEFLRSLPEQLGLTAGDCTAMSRPSSVSIDAIKSGRSPNNASK